MKTKTFAITNLEYLSSAQSLENHLQSLNGIQKVQASLASQSIQVDYDERKISVEDILQAIRLCGYEVSVFPVEETELLSSIQDTSSHTKRTVFSVSVWLILTCLTFLPVPFFVILLSGILFCVVFHKTILKCIPHSLSMHRQILTSCTVLMEFLLFLVHRAPLFLWIGCSILGLQEILFHVEVHTPPHFLQQPTNTYVNVYANHCESSCSIDHLHPSDQIVLRQGEMIPADGTVTKGFAYVDESPLSGNSQPVEKNVHSYVYANSRILKGSITMQVEQLGNTTAMMRFQLAAKKTAEQHTKVSPMESIGNTLGWYMLAGSLMAGISWFLYGHSFSFSLSAALGVLCGSCVHVYSEISRYVVEQQAYHASKKHILFCNPDGLKTLKDCDTFFIEQNGAITQDYLTVTDCFCRESVSEARFEYIVYVLVSRSSRDFSQAITRYLRSRHLSDTNIQEFRTLSRTGSRAFSSLGNCSSGTPEKFEEEHMDLNDWKDRIEACRKEGKEVILFRENDEVIGLIAAKRQLLPSVREKLEHFSVLGKKVLLFTTGSLEETNYLQSEFPSLSLYRNYTQSEKLRLLYSHYQNAETIAYISEEGFDGLEEAIDVRILIHAGTNIESTNCDILLPREDLQDVLEAIFISKKGSGRIQKLQTGVVIYHCLALVLFCLVFPGILSIPVFPLLGKLFSTLAIAVFLYFSKQL